jgi:hypothetical protein
MAIFASYGCKMSSWWAGTALNAAGDRTVFPFP